MSSLDNFTKDKIPFVTVSKSYKERSKSFVTPDFSNRETWFYDTLSHTGETASDQGDHINYDFASGKTCLNLDKSTDRDNYLSKYPQIYVSGTLTNDYTISYNSSNKSTITFGSALQASDIVTVDWHEPQSSLFEITAEPGTKILLDYVETQFSSGSVINDTLSFELVLNHGGVGNNDYVAGYSHYKTAADYMNKANHGTVLEPFGELTQKINIFPWDYLTGFVIKPIGDDSVIPTENEFNKIKIYLANDLAYTNCEIATATFYTIIRPL